MSNRRFTRKTNAFSKKVENHALGLSLHFMCYNFCRQHQSLGGISPAMAAGMTDTLWDLDNIIELVERLAPKPERPKRYKKRAKISN